MTARTEVTPESVHDYLRRTMTRDNYHLMYGLHLLSRDRYIGIMDALLNGDLQPEELVRLGGYSDAEADLLLGQVLTGWTAPSVAVPHVGTPGYSYLTRTLGLSAAGADAPVSGDGISPRRLIAARIIVGAHGHSGLLEVSDIFEREILPVALAGRPAAYYVPEDQSGVIDLPIPNQDDARSELLVDWLGPILQPILGPADGTLLRRLIPVAGEYCALRESPGLAEWMLRSPRPGRGTKLLLHREAASRSASGEYTLAELETLLAELEASSLDHVGTANKLTVIEFKASVLSAALAHHYPEREDLSQRAAIIRDVLTAMHDHRDALRAFAKRILAGCERHLIGEYPPA